MFKKLLFKSLNIALLASLVISKPVNECDEYSNYIKNNGGNGINVRCDVNDEGRIKLLYLEGNGKSNSKIIEKIASYKSIESLTLEGMNLNKIKFKTDGFKKLTKVTFLDIAEEDKISNSVFKFITKFTNLQELNIRSVDEKKLSIKESDFKLLNNLKSLQYLDIYDVDKSKKPFDNVCEYVSIDYVDINDIAYPEICSLKDKCRELKKFIDDMGEDSESIISSCGSGLQGQLETIKFKATQGKEKLNPKIIEKIFSYDTIISLEYIHDYFTIEEDEFPISRLTDLEYLTIINSNHGHSSQEVGEKGRGARRFGISKNIISSIPDSVRVLTLKGIDLTQGNVDEIASLSHFEILILYELNLNESKLNFDQFKKLTNVTGLYIAEESKVEKAAFDIILKFSNVKNLEFEGTLHPLTLKKDNIKLLKNLKYLESVHLINADINEELINNICTLTNARSILKDYAEIKVCEESQSPKISTNGKCGKEYGQCPNNKCCSKYGYCGTSDKYCGKGCQSEFGRCN